MTKNLNTCFGLRHICVAVSVAVAFNAFSDDRDLFFLKGPVKTATFDCVTSFQSFPATAPVTRSFSEDGTLLPNPNLGEMTVTRQDDSVTFSYNSWEGSHQETFNITPDGKLAAHASFSGISEDTLYEYFLSTENGDLDLETITITHPSGQKTYTGTVYKVIERDKYGNWTRRTAKVNKSYVREETCRITYYE